MKPLSVLEHMKLLKTAIPVRQSQSLNSSNLPVFRKLKTMSKRQINSQGIFARLSFCLWFKQDADQKQINKFNDIVVGVFMQGGQIVQFIQNMGEKYVKFVISDKDVNINDLRIKLKGLIKYEMILSTEFVSDSLKSLKRRDFKNYILYDNTGNINEEVNSQLKAKQRLQQQELDANLLRPSLLQLGNEQSGKGDRTSSFDMMKETQWKKNQNKNKLQKEINMLDDTGEEKLYNQLSHKNIDQIYDFFESYEDIHEFEHNLQNNPQSTESTQSPTVANEKHQNIIDPFKKNPRHITSAEFKQFMEKQKQRQNKRQAHKKYLRENQLPPNPQLPWETKRDRRIVWYEPPKKLASHSFPKNNLICEKLTELSNIYKGIGDVRCYVYNRVVSAIRAFDKQIKTIDDLSDISILTPTMTKKIKEILQTGETKQLKKLSVKEDVSVCRQLEKVWGLGSKRAKDLYNMGIKTVDQLRKRPDLINKNMAVGLKYFDEFSKRIPREKVGRIFEEFKKIFFRLVFSDKLHNLQVVGSYRRGKATCGDIDILICRHDGSVEAKLMQKLIIELQQRKFITESLTTPKLFDGKNCSAYMGVCLFEGVHHRIDIKHYPVDQYAFALMYFTGSDLFNRNLRMVAHNKGLMLSDHGIKTKERNGQIKCWKGGPLPVLKTQKQIFEFLGKDYCTPAERQF